MAVLSIRTIGDPVLRQKAQPVERVTRRHRRLIEDMRETMYQAPGVGLAANQVGVLERIIVVDPGESPLALINPVIVRAEGSDVDVEGCLSIPGVSGYVERARRVQVRGLDERGRPVELDAEGYLARILQHEVDHLDGVLFVDKALRLVESTETESTETSTPVEVGGPPRPAAGAGGKA